MKRKSLREKERREAKFNKKQEGENIISKSTQNNGIKDAVFLSSNKIPANFTPDPDELKLFIKGLPFDASADQIKNHFEQAMASDINVKVKKVLLVKDQATGLSRGTAFLVMHSRQDVDAVLNKARLEIQSKKSFGKETEAVQASSLLSSVIGESLVSKLTGNKQINSIVAKAQADVLFSSCMLTSMDGRQLYLFPVVDKQTALSLAMTKRQAKQDQDKHCLYLLYDCLPDKQLYPELFKLRQRDLNEAKKRFATRPNLKVSDMRLCFRHVPKNVDEKTLKSHFRDLLHAATVTNNKLGNEEANASSDLNRRDVKTLVPIKQFKLILDERGKSKGFGFLQLKKSEHAKALIKYVIKDPRMAWKRLAKMDLQKHPEGVPVLEYAVDRMDIVKRRVAKIKGVAESDKDKKQELQGKKTKPQERRKELKPIKKVFSNSKPKKQRYFDKKKSK